jgi:arylsulfatase A
MKQWSKLMLLICAVLQTVCCTAQSKKPVKAAKPNIIYILADDMGYGDLSCYGQMNFSTPTLDSLAATGIRFTDHYAGSPVCAPSRASLVTGRDVGHSRVRGNHESSPLGFGSGYPLLPEDPTIAEVLKKGGYATALIGKWGLGMNSTTGAPNKKGFDYFYGFLNQAHAHYQYPDYLHRNMEKVSIPENNDGKYGKFSGDIFTSESLQYIKKQKADQPFFLYLSYITPHAELIVPDDSLFHSFKGKFNETPFVNGKQGSNGRSDFGAYRSQTHPLAAYATMVTRMDNDVKKIVNQLKKQGLLENTVIMFSSDNGPHKEGGSNPAALNSAAGLRGTKRDVYEGGIRVPFVVNWPAVIKKSIVSDHISGFCDIMPTLAELAGVDLKKNKIPTEGISLVPVFKNIGNVQKHAYLYWEFHENKIPDQALRIGHWKGVRHGLDSAIELYDLSKDRAESNNIASQHPDIIKRMEEVLKTAREPHEIWSLNKTGKP